MANTLIFLKKTNWTSYVIKANSLGEDRFGSWLLYPGMLFGALEKWWGKGGHRIQSHEGLDLSFYRDRHNRVCHLEPGMLIPVLHDGTVAGIIDDFLGQSVIVRHDTLDSEIGEYCTMYGHTIPQDGIGIGRRVQQGEIIARLADASRSRSNVLAHLHISIGLPRKPIRYDRLDWKAIGDPGTMRLFNPLSVIDRYRLVPDPGFSP